MSTKVIQTYNYTIRCHQVQQECYVTFETVYFEDFNDDLFCIDIAINLDTGFENQSLGTYHFESFQYESGKVYNVHINDFILPLAWRSVGLGSFVFHTMFSLIPKMVRQCPQHISGSLLASEKSKERDKLWGNLVGHQNLSINKNGEGGFSGEMRDVGDSWKSKLSVSLNR